MRNILVDRFTGIIAIVATAITVGAFSAGASAGFTLIGGDAGCGAATGSGSDRQDRVTVASGMATALLAKAQPGDVTLICLSTHCTGSGWPCANSGYHQDARAGATRS
jgi:hypothetical protein